MGQVQTIGGPQLVTAALAGCTSFEGPLEVETGIPEVTYISPMNADGIQDVLVVPVNVPVLYKNMKVTAYDFSIPDGRIAHTCQ